MITIYRRGRIWWARGSVLGRKIKRRSLDTQDRNVAAQRRARLELELEAGVQHISWKDFEKAFLAWIHGHLKTSSLRKYEFVLHRFGQFLRAHSVDQVAFISPLIISNYIGDRLRDRHPHRSNTLSAETIKSDLRILRRVFSYALDCHYLAENPVRVPRLNTEGGKTLPFSLEELERIVHERLVQQRPELLALVMMFLYTGLRLSDVVSLPKKALDFGTDQLVLRTQKRGRLVSLSLHPSLRSALTEHLERQTEIQRANPLVFTTRAGKPLRNVDGLLRRVFRRAGIEAGHAHRFRDTFAVRLLEKGASLYDVAKLLGITVPVAEKHYAPYVQELQARARRLIHQLDPIQAENITRAIR